MEKFPQAKDRLLKCYNILKIDGLFQEKGKELKIKVTDLLGRCYYDLGIFDEAEDALKEALELKRTTISPDDSSFLSKLPTFINLSKTQMELNKFKEALDNANLAMAEDASKAVCDQIALANRGRCYMQ